ncbi:MAG: thiamine pyrophosphate-dependent dehydrogenase E1 component subunit alpha [Gemmatimonadales bacterium]
MKRYPAFDPPEYHDWVPDPDVVAEFVRVLDRDAERRAIVNGLENSRRLALYEGMVRARLHDIMLKRWVRQGVISKAWLATGEEAVTIGTVHALKREIDVVAPMIRNAGACCEMGMSLADMLRGYLATADSPTRGRDGHVGSWSHRVLNPISNIGNMPPLACGIALAFKLRGEDGVALTWIGDGSVKAGPTHEALNMAAVQHLPVIFIIQNNRIALGTRVEVHHVGGDFSNLHEAYGAAGWSFDGNNVLDAYAATVQARQLCSAGEGPVILSADTFRMGGHATHDEAEARQVLPAEVFEYWGKRDPIGLYEEWLKSRGTDASELEALEQKVIDQVDDAAEQALASKASNIPVPATAVDGVYAR